MKSKIYVLRNPITNEAFYIGATTKELSERLKHHYLKVNEAERGDINWNNRLTYLKNLLPHKAKILLIKECDNTEQDELEKFYINKYSKKYKLTNSTIGGIGGNTYSLRDDEDKKLTGQLISDKLKGVKKPFGFAQNLSETRQGYSNPMGGKTKYSPIILDCKNKLIIFRNSIEANLYFNNKYCWGNLIGNAKHNKTHNNKWFYKGVYHVMFIEDCKTDIKDIVESLLEKEGNCYVYNKDTKEITIK
jgi:hypothetical protein